MKNILAIVLIFGFSLNGITQTYFEEGYIIDNNDVKKNCLIKNIDWKNNPITFKYKSTEDSKIEEGNIETIKEFGIGDKAKYYRSKISIDRSSDDLKSISYVKKAEFKEETLYLKTLVEGKASLYYYEDENLNRFFYKVDGSEISQLVYKKYAAGDGLVGENNRFRQQLLIDLKCNYFFDSNNIKYQKNSLIAIFKRYNECTNSKFIEFGEKDKKGSLKLKIKSGLMLNSLAMLVRNTETVKYQNLVGFKIGVSGEYNLPFNNNKWAILLEPAFQSFKFDRTANNSIFSNETISSEVDYKSIELSLGLKHYFFLNENSTIFIDGFTILDISLVSNIKYNNGPVLKNETPLINYSLGLGFEYHSKYSAELRYSTRRNLLNDYVNFNGDFSGFALILGYTIL
jgi:hypothetical protein